MKRMGWFLIILSICLLTSCMRAAPPANVNQACAMFKQYPKWYRQAKDVERRWKVPVEVQLAIIHQESKFDSNAMPKRKKLLWVIPWSRPSSAYGYTQALQSTWKNYRQSRGGAWASREDFGDAVDFIGWYANQAYKRAGILRNDAYQLYLAYHEGIGGYERKTYLKKPWLIQVARKVKYQSHRYASQLNYC